MNTIIKTILVDAVFCFVSQEGQIFQEMYELLETYSNPKIILTGANDEQFKKFGLDKMPYPVFTLNHNPEKSDPRYFEIFLQNSNLNSSDVIYFEHDQKAVESAKSKGIITYFYDFEQKDLVGLRHFLTQNLK